MRAGEVRIGLVSFAHMHGASYAGALARMPGVEIVGVADDDAARRRDMAARYAGGRAFDGVQALLAEKPDGIVVCSENARHREFTVPALEAGVAVLCEKPLAATLEDGRAMVRTARERGAHLATAFPCRFHPAAARTRRAMQGGEVGVVRAVSATNHGQVPPGWFTDPAQSGGGAVMDHTVHVVDLLRWMTGAEVRSVYALNGNLRTDLPVEDLGIVSMAMSNGVVATLDASWSRPGHFPTWGDVTMEVIGEEGTLSLDLFAQSHAVYRARVGADGAPAEPAGQPVQWMNWGDDMDRGLVDDFVAALREGRAPSVTGEDGLAALEVTVAAYRSIERGEPVALPLE
jgi:UDP-N-acetylglucosamine 3-dehydrogenase